MFLNVQFMKMTDRVVLDYLRENASGGEVHVVYEKLADSLQCARNTVYRSVGRLRTTGHIEMAAGNNRVGYTYRVK